jgi:ubiquinone/menaquinone biosynthesis C-methylase UbiE
MAVASHLHIRLEEYDDRIVTFVPGYHALVANAASAVATLAAASPHIVDLGTGSGALAARCLAECPAARLTAIDEDPEILTLAMARLKDRTTATFVQGSFTSVPLPACDAFVASLSLHHIRTADAKRAFYQRCSESLSAGGLLVTADCCPATDARLRDAQLSAWRAHLQRTYSPREADAFLAAWAVEDVYFTLDEERAMLAEAGFSTDVVWREGAMAVIVAELES